MAFSFRLCRWKIWMVANVSKKGSFVIGEIRNGDWSISYKLITTGSCYANMFFIYIFPFGRKRSWSQQKLECWLGKERKSEYLSFHRKNQICLITCMLIAWLFKIKAWTEPWLAVARCVCVWISMFDSSVWLFDKLVYFYFASST